MAAMPDLNRRHAMSMAGLAALAAAMPIPAAGASPSRQDLPLDRVPPPAAPPGGYLFQDEFDGPAGSAPDPSKWEVAQARETMEDPTFWELPGNVGQYRDDRRNVFLDGKSNLVFRAAKDGDTYYSGKLFGNWQGRHRPHLGSPDQAELPHPGCLARVVSGQQQPGQRRRSRRHGVVRQRPLGRGNRRPREVERRRTREPRDHRGQRVAHVARPVG